MARVIFSLTNFFQKKITIAYYITHWKIDLKVFSSSYCVFIDICMKVLKWVWPSCTSCLFPNRETNKKYMFNSCTFVRITSFGGDFPIRSTADHIKSCLITCRLINGTGEEVSQYQPEPLVLGGIYQRIIALNFIL